MTVESHLFLIQMQGFLEFKNKKEKENIFPGLFGVN